MQKKIRNHCFGCGRDNPLSMRLKFNYDDQRRRMICHFRLATRYSGPPGYCHGGIIATVLDEAMAKLNKPAQITAVTAQMSVDYLRPVPLQEPLQVDSREIKVHGRRRVRSAQILNAKGELLARGRGVFVTIAPRTI